MYLPYLGTASLIGGLAMLYKFFNTPFFPCHLLGVFMLGVCYDVCCYCIETKKHWPKAVATCFMSYLVFALLITYVFQYEHWVAGGLMKIVTHVGLYGTLAALISSLLLPAVIQAVEKGRQNAVSETPLWPRIVTSGCWLLALGMFIKAIS